MKPVHVSAMGHFQVQGPPEVNRDQLELEILQILILHIKIDKT